MGHSLGRHFDQQATALSLSRHYCAWLSVAILWAMVRLMMAGLSRLFKRKPKPLPQIIQTLSEEYTLETKLAGGPSPRPFLNYLHPKAIQDWKMWPFIFFLRQGTPMHRIPNSRRSKRRSTHCPPLRPKDPLTQLYTHSSSVQPSAPDWRCGFGFRVCHLSNAPNSQKLLMIPRPFHCSNRS